MYLVGISGRKRLVETFRNAETGLSGIEQRLRTLILLVRKTDLLLRQLILRVLSLLGWTLAARRDTLALLRKGSPVRIVAQEGLFF